MKVLSFLGFFPTIWLLFSTYMLAGQMCDSIGCDCLLQIADKNFYILAGGGFFLFFLIYCSLFLFRISLKPKKIESVVFIEHTVLDQDSVIEENYDIVMLQLPWVRFLTHIGLVVSVALLFFAFLAIPYIICFTENCENIPDCLGNFSYREETYILGYGACGIYFLILTWIGLLKSYPSDFNFIQNR